jgi:putative hydrolase of the HAD superfamily
MFDLYSTLIDDSNSLAQREKYRLDSIYTILEKSNYPTTFAELSEKYGKMTFYTYDYHESDIAFSPFAQIDYLLKSLNVNDIVVFKKVYDAYTGAVLHILPKPMKNAKKALELLKSHGIKIGLISNTGKTPGMALRLMLKSIELYQYFDDTLFSDEVGFLKPNKHIFDIAIDRLAVERKETIFIGDLKASDYDGAIAAGLNAHLFDPVQEDLYKLALVYSGEMETF